MMSRSLTGLENVVLLSLANLVRECLLPYHSRRHTSSVGNGPQPENIPIFSIVQVKGRVISQPSLKPNMT